MEHKKNKLRIRETIKEKNGAQKERVKNKQGVSKIN